MSASQKINDEITVGPQPSEPELKQILDDGFRSVINLRTEGESDQPLAPQEEGVRVRSLSMEYVHIPVAMKSLEPDVVDQFRAAYAELPKPIYAHCKGGTRAAALTVMHLAAERGLAAETALQWAEKELGVTFDRQPVQDCVCEYLDQKKG